MTRSYLSTPGLEAFEVHWPVDTQNVPFTARDDGEFLQERFIEDVIDAAPTGTRPDFVIVETRMPTDWSANSVEIVFHIVTTMDCAKLIQQMEFEIYPLRDKHPDWDYRASAHDGMTWGELQQHICQLISSGKVSANDIAALTDDNDSEAPWFIITGTVRGDNGMHFTAEEFKP
jgi:hypothetical protein